MNKIQEEIYNKYTILIYIYPESDTFSVMVNNNNARSRFRTTKYHYSFSTIVKAQDWISQFKKIVDEYEQRKADRKAERKARGRNDEETKIIKTALAEKYGYKNVRVTRGKGTAGGWIGAHVQLQQAKPQCENCKIQTFNICYQCGNKRSEARNEVYRIAKDAMTKAGKTFGTWYGDDDYAKEEFNYDVTFVNE